MRRLLIILVLLGAAATAWLFYARSALPGAGPSQVAAPSMPRETVKPPSADSKKPPAPAAPFECKAEALAKVGTATVQGKELCPRLARLAGAGAPPAVARQQARQLLDSMIVAEAVASELASLGATVTDSDVSKVYAEEVPRGPDSDPAQEDLRRALRERLELDKLLELRGELTLSDQDVRAEYERDPRAFGAPATTIVEAYLVRHPSADASARASAHIFATRISTALRSGRPDGSLAAAQHVARMEISAAGPEPDLYRSTSALSPRTWSAPLESRAGWVVVRVMGGTPPSVRPFEAVRGQAEDRGRARLLISARLKAREAMLASPSVARYVAW